MKIAVDAMGGDKAPASVVGGVVQALRNEDRLPSFDRIEGFYLVGNPTEIEAELRTLGCDEPRIQIVPASEVIEMDESPVQAIRRKKDSSMARAIDLVKQGQADAVLSAGNTGALMVGSH